MSPCSAAAFSGFGDDDAGFYQTYSRAFQEVWERERDWGEPAAAPGEESWGNGDPPEIGRSTDGYETAEAFYNRWICFVSGMSFGWVDEYNVNEVSIICPWCSGTVRIGLNEPIKNHHSRKSKLIGWFFKKEKLRLDQLCSNFGAMAKKGYISMV